MDLFLANILYPILTNLDKEKDAFFIKEKSYSYQQFKKCILKIRRKIEKSVIEKPFVGLVANDDLETYASIIALWIEGKAYIPLHQSMPMERCEDIINQVEISLILDSSESTRHKNCKVISTLYLPEIDDEEIIPKVVEDANIAYILFTSGSTGSPKGVPITRANITAFVKSFWEIGYEVDETDRFLQAFDLTFDLSVMSYLVPMLRGASIFTVPHDQIKYSYIAELLEDQMLTFALMVPSTIRYLRPYFDEINLPNLKYSLFCGEALPIDITQEWSLCAPNAIIDNVYGPTENTIFCSCYRYSRTIDNKHYNGCLAIGKPMSEGKMDIFDEEMNLVTTGTPGELCLSGTQLTPGYWKNQTKNIEAFFLKNETIYYRSGDLCIQDKDGDFLYIGRIDSQIKIQGFRVELGEIEYHASAFLSGENTVAIAYENQFGTTEIALFIESSTENKNAVNEYLQTKVPSYMLPSNYYLIKKFPLNKNGKVDRKQLKSMIQ